MKNLLTIIGLLCLNFLIPIDTKQNYRIDIDRGALSYYNQIFAKNILFDYTKPNKSNVIVSVTYDVISEDIKSDARLILDTYRSVKSTWKRIPINVDLNICDMFSKNLYLEGLQDMMKHGNITPCDVKKARYYMKDYMPVLNFPPVVPSGSYKVQGTVKLKSEIIFKMVWYAFLNRIP